MSKRRRLIIRPAKDELGSTLFPFHQHMSSRSKRNWLNIGRMITGDPLWHPDEVLYIESHKQIVDIMQESPIGKQACL